jgi:TolB-like protein
VPDLEVPGEAFGRRPLVAVLPFQTLGADPSLQGLGSEIADVLRERLESDPVLQAILISSDFLSKAPPHAIELICRELRVGYLISGKCHGHGGEPSLYVEVTDTRDWHIRWANFYRERARSLLVDEADSMSELVASLRRLLIEQPAR